MARQVFISYSSQDKAIADRVCGALEAKGILCWIAPRDIGPGIEYPSAIVAGISAAEALVVLLTAHAFESPHILSEVEHAFNDKKTLLPVRLSPGELPPDFDYFLSTQQWLDASDGFTDETLTRLLDAVTVALAGAQVPQFEVKPKKRTALMAGAAVALAAAIGIFGYSRLTHRPSDTTVHSPVVTTTETAPPATDHPAPVAGPKIWLNPKDGLKYVWAPPGTFTMGCSAGDGECKDEEKPTHRVEIQKGFWLGQTEVTNAAYRLVTSPKAPAAKEGPDLPVRGLSWPQARAYCAATGGRLPTEAEWEYAARAGVPEAYYGVPSKIAWYSANSEEHTHPVGQKAPNAFGLYDMLGNVSEWVLDRYYNKYDLEADAQGTHIDLPLAGNSSAIVRGGFWDGELTGLRVSHRAEQLNDQPVETAGVRCANDHP